MCSAPHPSVLVRRLGRVVTRRREAPSELSDVSETQVEKGGLEIPFLFRVCANSRENDVRNYAIPTQIRRIV